MRFVACTGTATLVLGATCMGFSQEPSSDRATLTLLDGSSVTGSLLGSDEPQILRWQGASFTEPFEFVVPVVSSISFPTARPTEKPAGDFSFELTGGDVLTGQIRDWSDESITIESPHFGKLSILRRAIQRMYRIDENPSLVYTGPAGLAGWVVNAPGWREDGPHLRTELRNASLTGEFSLPDRAVVELELTWDRTPDFVIALGIEAQSKPDARLDGWRFETWGDQERTLALVCERRQTADVAEIAVLPASSTSTRSKSPPPADYSDIDPFRSVVGGDDINRTHFRSTSTPRQSAPAKPSVPEKRLHLIAYLDQPAGSLKVYRPDGTFVAEVVVPPSAGDPVGREVKRTIRLINRNGDLRLERLRVARWSGILPHGGGGPERLELADGNVVTGTIIGIREGSGAFVLKTDDGERSVAVDDVVVAEFASEAAPEERRVSVTLTDGTRLSGTLGGLPAGEVVVVNPGIAQQLHIPHTSVRSLTFTRNLREEVQQPSLQGRRGTLELSGQKLVGLLAVATETADASCLAWQPIGSRTASPIKPRAAGRIVYREPPKPRTIVRQATSVGPVLQFPRQVIVGGAMRPSQTLPSAPKRRQGAPHDMHLRSGDVVPCEVIAIDERGIHITSPVTDAKVIPHSKVKAIEFAAGALPSLRAAKRERLLTLPRAQRDSPPTHLLLSRTGDLLRCRLITLGPEFVRVEIQLAEVDIPAERLARIVWFHEDEITTPEDPADGPVTSQTKNSERRSSQRGEVSSLDDGINRTHFDPSRRAEPLTAPKPIAENGHAPVEAPLPHQNRQLVQVVRSDGNRTTFDVEAVDGLAILGTSDVLGACRFALTDVDAIAFGERIEAAAGLPYAAWRLHHAVEPLVAQDFDGSGGDDGTASPLVGQPAPEISLTLLDGGSFRLSQCKGQIVVLDFWASWCGPCMQTMPLTEQTMAEFDPNLVRLVAVNLEEPAAHVQGVMERHNLHTPVALDMDGVAARRYQADAIPQVVIVDREGKISRVFIGGGREAVEQLKLALQELLSEG